LRKRPQAQQNAQPDALKENAPVSSALAVVIICQEAHPSTVQET